MWAGAGIMGAMTVLWLFLSLSTCCVAYGKRSASNGLRRQRLTEVGRQRCGNGRSGERDPLLQ